MRKGELAELNRGNCHLFDYNMNIMEVGCDFGRGLTLRRDRNLGEFLCSIYYYIVLNISLSNMMSV
jgi:hypothetical protein